MKTIKLFVLSGILVSSLLLSGCSIFKPAKDRAVKDEAKNRAKVVSIEQSIAANNVDKLDNIAGLAFGTDYALSKIPTPTREVVVAKDINQRIISLTGSPNIEKMKEMQEMIDKLTSTLEKERIQGKKKLADKDDEILNIQEESKILIAAKDSALKVYMDKAAEAAALSDSYRSKLAEYEGWFGIKAIFKGLWQLIKTSAWILGIGTILFIILRIASVSNPIAASIFSIFTTIASWFINIIKLIVPKAVEAVGYTANSMFNLYKSTLTKIVDGIQIVRDRSTASGKTPTIQEVLDEVAKTMNDDEKAIVDELKKALNWKP